MARYRTLSLFLLTAVLALAAAAAASASTPKLSLTCGLPNHQVVACRLTGNGFRAHEHVRITYHVELTALAPVRGKFPTKVYRRVAQADARGAFSRPTLRFFVVKYHESYRITVTAIGDRGNHAASTLTGIAQ